MRFSITKVILSFLLLSGVIVILWFWNAQEKINPINASLPKSFPTQGFSHQTFATLLKQFVDNQGYIDYQSWKQTPQAHNKLKQYLAAVAKYSPDSHPERFNSKPDILAYWIYSYNALVIHSILEHWPLRSVTDVKAPLEIIKDLGFFYKQKFIVGGKAYNLYHLEQQKMVQTKSDPRSHFILNCGSASCPPMRPELPVGVELEPFLQRAAIEFINNPDNVRINSATQSIELSKIFKWYIENFAATSPLQKMAETNKKINTPSQTSALISYIEQYANVSLKEQLQQAKSKPIEYIEYDWTINSKQAN